MKTVRFSNVVEKAGQPETHLIFVEPSKDRELQAAIKAHRVLTVQQTTVGNKTDRGEVGFHPGSSRQFLVFPKSLRAFEGRSVVGIKYELLNSPEVPKSKRAAPPQPPKKPRKAPAAPKSKPAQPKKEQAERPPSPAKSKVVPFEPAPPAEEEDEDIAEIKKQVRHAMDLLEEGKAVASFNVLKRIVAD